MNITRKQVEALETILKGRFNGIPGPYVSEDDDQELLIEKIKTVLKISYKIGDSKRYKSQVTFLIDENGEGTYTLNGLGTSPSVP